MLRLVLSALLITALLMSGCSRETDSGAQSSADWDSWLEVQIAVRNTPYLPGDDVNSGEYRVVAANMVPVPRDGGPGHVASFADGVLVEMRWSEMQPLPNGESGILFKDFRWRIGNRLIARDGSRTIGWSGPIQPDTQTFTSEFDWLMTPVSLRPTKEEETTGPVLVIRGRRLPNVPKLPEVYLEEGPAHRS